MAYRKILGANGSVIKQYVYDEAENKHYVRTYQDAQPTIEMNKRLRNDGTNGYTPSREYRRVASIPANIFNIWFKENPNILRDDKALKAKIKELNAFATVAVNSI